MRLILYFDIKALNTHSFVRESGSMIKTQTCRHTDRHMLRPGKFRWRYILFWLINHYIKSIQGQRSCQYSCSIPDCVVPTAVCTHVLYQGPDQCTQTVQYRPCMTSFKLFWKLCRNRPTDRRTNQPTYLSLDASLPNHNNCFLYYDLCDLLWI